ncbi:NepR family anti-sigma factor [Glycocaulis abyssi]|uniref:NepR family anti-sigma factor n=1 Tax=Glycocaulis abyssi TaxID=1433403 RepID=A0ABV9NBK4_9PROT
MSAMNKSDDKPDAQAVKSRQRVIGARLQAVYDDVVRQGVPDDFEQMLAALDELEEQPGTPPGSGSRRNEG